MLYLNKYQETLRGGPAAPRQKEAHYNEKERGVVAMSMSVAAAIKKVLDTPILTEDGKLTDESKSVHAEMEKYIETIEVAEAWASNVIAAESAVGILVV